MKIEKVYFLVCLLILYYGVPASLFENSLLSKGIIGASEETIKAGGKLLCYLSFN